MTPETAATRRLTGKHVLAIAIACFATVVGANMAMLTAATSSFPGLVVESAYREGRGWNERERAQSALAWAPEASYRAGEIAVRLEGPEGTVRNADLTLSLGRPATDRDDVDVTLTYRGGAYRAPVDLAPGRWRLDLRGVDGTSYSARLMLTVPEEAG